MEEKNKENYEWHSLLEKNPDSDGIYYVFTSNCMDNSNDIRKIELKNGNWIGIEDEYTKILAWKSIAEKTLENETQWLKEHIYQIRKKFYNDEIDYKDCCVAETLDECICEYEFFLYENHVCMIDGLFVIRII